MKLRVRIIPEAARSFVVRHYSALSSAVELKLHTKEPPEKNFSILLALTLTSPRGRGSVDEVILRRLLTRQRTFVGQPFQADSACPIYVSLGKAVRLESLTYITVDQGALSC